MKITIEIDTEEVEEEKYSSYEKEWWDKYDTTSEHGGV